MAPMMIGLAGPATHVSLDDRARHHICAIVPPAVCSFPETSRTFSRDDEVPGAGLHLNDKHVNCPRSNGRNADMSAMSADVGTKMVLGISSGTRILSVWEENNEVLWIGSQGCLVHHIIRVDHR